jgi:hypothetical protein
MSRLPVPGSDNGVWGDLLNDFLLQAHNPDGTLIASSVGTSQLQDSAVTSAQLASGAVTANAVQDGGLPHTKISGLGSMATKDSVDYSTNSELPNAIVTVTSAAGYMTEDDVAGLIFALVD